MTDDLEQVGAQTYGLLFVSFRMSHHPKMFDQITSSNSNARRTEVSGVDRSKLAIVEDLSQSLS